MKRWITIIAIFIASSLAAQTHTETLYRDIEGVEITASLKGEKGDAAPVSATILPMLKLEERGVTSVKEISALSPNFYQPEYGSSITSSIYVRGFGSRIDQPVLGVIIDNVPVMNKNAFDFDFYDIRRVELLRGPQGTLYGRNTSGGVMNITTLSPLVWQGVRAMAEYSTVASYRASAAYYALPRNNFGISVAAAFNHDGGHTLNAFTDEICDSGNSGSARVRMQWHRGAWSLDNTLSAGYTSEGGYAYHHYDPTTHHIEDVEYNDPSSYKRLTINEGFTAQYVNDKVRVSSVTSYQYLDDTMTLDQDFSPKSMFTMQQMQREHTITEEIVIRNSNENDKWQWLSGAFIFAKWLDMSSPVTFKEEGINDLIVGNINENIHKVFPDNNMTIREDSFVINSDFKIPTYGAALYHQSSYRLNRWNFTAGLRLDFEAAQMRYNSNATVNYMFDYTMSDFKQLQSTFAGNENDTFFEILPKIAVQYYYGSRGRGNVYATVTRGYKAGGYNTQIFSDILQAQMMNDMMSDLGIELDSAVGTTTYDSASATRYKPETTWNFEVGTHLNAAKGLHIDASMFWIECFDQQVTVLPKGKNTGRMMSNAARSRSIGAELSADYSYKGLNINLNYGYTNAKFRKYNDGNADYAGKFLPYAPQNTINVVIAHTWRFDNDNIQMLTLSADWRGIGSIYWDENNTLKQPFYSLLGANISLRMRDITLTLWGRNLTNTRYNTFYFKSVGEEFFSQGRPIEVGIRLNLNI